jgi:hypothetical protein
MTLHQLRKGQFVPAIHVAFEKFAIAAAQTGIRPGNATKVPGNSNKLPLMH